jgi:hypothetical protein
VGKTERKKLLGKPTRKCGVILKRISKKCGGKLLIKPIRLKIWTSGRLI